MRADRLLSLLMLLQARGRLTAGKLARELEVSERTIYRDIDALSTAGVPVYGEPGPEGGYALLDSYRTNLTGLTEGEVRALFMLSIPQPLADLGVGRELGAALRKLSAALPAARRSDEQRVRQRFHLDATGWDQVEESAPHLSMVHQAVWQDRKLHLAYRIQPLAIHVEQTVDPYGLVAKAGIWHLVYGLGGAIRVLRVAALLDARLSPESCERPADFDLAAFLAGVVCGARREPRTLPCHGAGGAGLCARAAGVFRRCSAEPDCSGRRDSGGRRGLADVAAIVRIAGGSPSTYPGLWPRGRGVGALCPAAEHP